MITPEFFYKELEKNGTDFFTGVPDSLLKDFCAYLTDNVPAERNIIAANEGNAVGLAAGHYLATGRVPLVYMQNSGLGNTVNPLLSLADPEVYAVPMVLVVGWRGEPGFHDEPQHVQQGKCTCSLLDAMHIPYVIMSDEEEKLRTQIAWCYKETARRSAPFAFIVKKGTFAPCTLRNNVPVSGGMTREQAIERIMLSMGTETVFVSTTGMASRELFELREKHGQGHKSDFLTVGSMGHASQIALGIALQDKARRVCCIDGDGAAIMHMGGMAVIGTRAPANYVHIVLNNGAHDSVGGQPTVGRDIDICGIARACGYRRVFKAASAGELESALAEASRADGLCFVEVQVLKGARKDLGRPTTTPLQNKEAFMEFLK